MAFDKAKADKAVAFFEKLLTHTKGKWAGVPFTLLPWQREDIIRPLFGTVGPEGNRAFSTVYAEVPKKAGKSELAAGVALKLLLADNEALPEVYSAATTREQASIVFNVAAQMVRKQPRLDRLCKIVDSRKRIVVKEGPSAGGFYQAISADAGSWDGENPSGIIFDEIHEQPNRALWETLTSSTVARAQPVVFGITTAGYDRHSLCWDLHEKARKLLGGQITDPSFLAVIYAAAMEDDWRDPAVWRKAHPSLGITLPLAKLEEKFRDAEQTPAYQNAFRRYFLNQWTSQDARWLDMGVWNLNAGELNIDRLAGRTCYAGLDLASTIDIAALVLLFPPPVEGGRYEVLPFFWVPQERLVERSRKDGVPYDLWHANGFLEATSGNVIDYTAIRQKIDELARRYYISEMAFDPWNATQLSTELSDLGMTMVEHRQGFASMSAPTKELMRLAMEKRLTHGANPVLDWMADNLVVETDPAGNLKPSRKKSAQKIDGMVALIMAIDRATRHEPSVYESRPITVLG